MNGSVKHVGPLIGSGLRKKVPDHVEQIDDTTMDETMSRDLAWTPFASVESVGTISQDELGLHE